MVLPPLHQSAPPPPNPTPAARCLQERGAKRCVAVCVNFPSLTSEAQLGEG